MTDKTAGLPDADYIGWLNLDTRNVEMASRVGHPANGVWYWRGIQYAASALLNSIGASKVTVLFPADKIEWGVTYGGHDNTDYEGRIAPISEGYDARGEDRARHELTTAAASPIDKIWRRSVGAWEEVPRG